MKRIIVPVDFTETSDNTACFAANLASFYGAELWMYHAFDVNIPVSGFDYPYVDTSEMQKVADVKLTDLKAKLLNSTRTNITIHMRAEFAVLVDGLSDLCEEVKPELIVMGLSGKSKLASMLIGSNTLRVIQHSTYPVLVIPQDAEFIPVRKIGFACDFEKMNPDTPVALIKKITKDFNAQLLVMNVMPQESTISNTSVHETGHVDNLLNDLKPEYHTIITEDLAEGINWFAEKSKIDWVVLIPKKHNLIDRLLTRSNTKHLLYHTGLPVLCIHE